MQRIYIYGSCVTRDGVDLWDDYGLGLAGYIARQSLISALSPANPNSFRTSEIASAFQRRMAEGDIRGNVVTKLTGDVDSYDQILWDITDERLGVYRVPSGGGFVSRVVDYTNGVYTGTSPLGTPIRIGTEEHRKLWLTALDQFVRRLDDAGVKDRLILNALPWATRDETGASTATPHTDPDKFNSVLDEYCAVVESHGIRVARTDPQRVVQANSHRWGAAPFHYTEDTYRASLEAVSALL